MKFLNSFIITFLLMFSNINAVFSVNEKNDLHYYQKIKLPYSSKELEKYYYWSDFGIKLSPNMPFPLRFSNKEFSFKPKLFEYLAKSAFYFPHIYFYYEGILYKGIIYMAIGENDANVFTFQLNSFDAQNNLIDAIVLYKIQNGEISYWNDFVIKTNGKILIKQHQQQNLFEFDEDPKKNDIQTKEIKYQMSRSGFFNKIK
ncbi:hypothetical protein A9G45_05305 [Gilliamella sp. HK2]|jgi:hypothetical protein|uniref:hypothetical protein n=1 Tax=unclassified Gilliamella TaxID=2685620 RepID=UPI00080E37D7|nr:hypothetical protein [Gilliamella apicola]OCG24932.1 hypothetical protein A9G46_00365 [Gilliamella apicola]OCG28960.1 hypothetical protein A9G45_05305 [Gilliamella apicola]